MADNYSNAFNCANCPQNNTENGCPAWTELVMENPETKEVRIDRACFFQNFQKLMIEVIKASNRPAAAIERNGNMLVNAFHETSQQFLRQIESKGNGTP